MTKTEAAWLAGLIEGEGYMSIATNRRENGRYIILGINMCDLDVLEKVQAITGVGYLVERKVYKENHSRSFSWKVSANAEVKAILRQVLPHLCIRRRARALELLEVELIRPARWRPSQRVGMA